jgi:hypothetical protein
MRDILVYAALILLMSQTDYHIFRISTTIGLHEHDIATLTVFV